MDNNEKEKQKIENEVKEEVTKEKTNNRKVVNEELSSKSQQEQQDEERIKKEKIVEETKDESNTSETYDDTGTAESSIINEDNEKESKSDFKKQFDALEDGLNKAINEFSSKKFYTSLEQKIREEMDIKKIFEEKKQRRSKWMTKLHPIRNEYEIEQIREEVEKMEEMITASECKIEQLVQDKKTLEEKKSNKSVNLENLMHNPTELHVLWAVLIALFPQMQWRKLQNLCNYTMSFLSTTSDELANSNNNEEMKKKSLFKYRLHAILRDINAEKKNEIVGELGELKVIQFIPDLRGIESYLLEEYADIILDRLLDSFLHYLQERNLDWIDRQQIGYTIGEFLHEDMETIFDKLEPLALHQDPRVRAAIGYVLSSSLEKGANKEEFTNMLIQWSKSNEQLLLWTTASVCKEIGKVDLNIALSLLGNVVRKSQEVFVIEAVSFSLIVLCLKSNYLDVIEGITKWIREEKSKNIRETYVIIYLHTLRSLINVSQQKLDEDDDKDDLQRKIAIRDTLLNDMEEKFQKGLSLVIRLIINKMEYLVEHLSKEILFPWIHLFSKKSSENADLFVNLISEIYDDIKNKQGRIPQGGRILKENLRRKRNSLPLDSFNRDIVRNLLDKI